VNPVSILRVPGQPPAYTMQLGGNSGYIRISPNPERAGRSTIAVYVLDPFESALPVRRLVLTTAVGDGPARQQPVLPLGRGRFAVPVVLQQGRVRIAVVARARIGLRLRAEFELDIPRG
jgi:hypothetical protein